ncbi:phosphoesterase, partial [Streptomyces sp. WAC 06725]|uniref:twin-arginine translocation signal domain-containing protein n=2 Tax=Streptomyces TaxID=1883 RepID=UPI000F746F4B
MDTPRVGIPEPLAGRLSMPEQHEYLRTKLTRRGLLRTSAVTAGAVAGGGLLAGPARAASPTLLSS